jgi:hypothetical protein
MIMGVLKYISVSSFTLLPQSYVFGLSAYTVQLETVIRSAYYDYSFAEQHVNFSFSSTVVNSLP